MSLRALVSNRTAFKPTDARGRYVARLTKLRTLRAAGVYAIFTAGGRCLYVGESHAGTVGRMYDTITRHFRSWRTDPATDTYGRRRGGTEYDRARVRVAFVVTEPEQAEALQFSLIQALHPRDNTDDGSSLEPAPF